MAQWDIQAPATGRLLAGASEQAQGYETDIGSVTSALEATGVALVNSPLAMSRVAEFAESVATPHLNKVVGHTASALQGTSAAVSAYMAGDTEMAAEAQRNASMATYPQDVPGVGGGG